MATRPENPRAQRLRESGHKLTHARLTVLEVLEQSNGHITSAELVERVSQVDSSIGRASVFRALDLFTRLSLVRPTYIDSSVTPTYVLMPDGHHHHIICTQCGRVIEFEDCDLQCLADQLEERLGVRLTGHLLEFYGLCPDCQKNAAPDR
ncbi:MAG: Fur family transcriptional regulator [Candidatus Flexifilum sp.]